MVKYGEFGPVIEGIAKEGNVTLETTHGIGGNVTAPKVASPIEKGMAVKLAGWDATENAPIFEACSAGDAHIGYAYNDPSFEVEPTASASYGSYKSRKFSVELRGHCVKTVPLEAANSAVSVGNYIKPGASTANKYDKDTNATTAIALQPADASSGAKIDVLFGFY